MNVDTLCFILQKAIMECGEEWSTNKKMIKLDGKPVTKMVCFAVKLLNLCH